MEARLLFGKASARINIRDCYKAWPLRHRTKEERQEYINKVYTKLEIDDLLRLSSRFSNVGAVIKRDEARIVFNPRRTKDPLSNPNVSPFEVMRNDGLKLDLPPLNLKDHLPEEFKKLLEEAGQTLN
jgi:hypothetical protein